LVTSMMTPPLSISAKPTFSFICWSYSHMEVLLEKLSALGFQLSASIPSPPLPFAC
jgi:hypothetical protein